MCPLSSAVVTAFCNRGKIWAAPRFAALPPAPTHFFRASFPIRSVDFGSFLKPDSLRAARPRRSADFEKDDFRGQIDNGLAQRLTMGVPHVS